MKNKISIIPIFISHMGCGNDCVFCNQVKITGISQIPDTDKVKSIIDSYLRTIESDKIEIAFYGGSFTGISVKEQIAYLEIAHHYKKKRAIHGIRLSTRPDYITPEVIERLLKYEVGLVELGCQSFNDSVLKASRRGHDMLHIQKAVKLLKDADIKFGIQLMAGLPEDTRERFMDSVHKSIALNPTTIRLYPALVIKDTEMEKQYERGLYKPLELVEAIEWCATAYKMFAHNGIDVIRVGLQKTDLIDLGADVVAGPFHPAFGALVMSKIFEQAIEPFVKDNDCLEVHVQAKQCMYINGQNKKNLNHFQSINPKISIKLLKDSTIPFNTIGVWDYKKMHFVDVMRWIEV